MHIILGCIVVLGFLLGLGIGMPIKIGGRPIPNQVFNPQHITHSKLIHARGSAFEQLAQSPAAQVTLAAATSGTNRKIAVHPSQQNKDSYNIISINKTVTADGEPLSQSIGSSAESSNNTTEIPFSDLSTTPSDLTLTKNSATTTLTVKDNVEAGAQKVKEGAENGKDVVVGGAAAYVANKTPHEVVKAVDKAEDIKDVAKAAERMKEEAHKIAETPEGQAVKPGAQKIKEGAEDAKDVVVGGAAAYVANKTPHEVVKAVDKAEDIKDAKEKEAAPFYAIIAAYIIGATTILGLLYKFSGEFFKFLGSCAHGWLDLQDNIRRRGALALGYAQMQFFTFMCTWPKHFVGEGAVQIWQDFFIDFFKSCHIWATPLLISLFCC